jgi:ClpP class serine protease
VQRQVLAARRRQSLAVLSRRRKATVITLIHRQETVSLLGIPLARYIDIDDSQSILRAIRETPSDRPIEIVLHTPGGLVLAARQIASALADHPAEVRAIVPHYAMSGGTLIALAADTIVVDPHSVLGPVDPQVGQYPAASVLAALDAPGERDDQTLILADVSRKAIAQVESFVVRLLEPKLGAQRAKDVGHLLATGTWTHDHPLQRAELERLGLPVLVGVEDEERELLDLYPQPRGREAAVEYVPGPRTPSREPVRRRNQSGRARD